MRRDIKLEKHNIKALACLVEKKNINTDKNKNYEIETSIITAVELKGSKSLQIASGDFGIVIYNELNLGFIVSWNQFEKLQSDLKISEKEYEKFLDDFTNDFSDTIINFIENNKFNT